MTACMLLFIREDTTQEYLLRILLKSICSLGRILLKSICCNAAIITAAILFKYPATKTVQIIVLRKYVHAPFLISYICTL